MRFDLEAAARAHALEVVRAPKVDPIDRQAARRHLTRGPADAENFDHLSIDELDVLGVLLGGAGIEPPPGYAAALTRLAASQGTTAPATPTMPPIAVCTRCTRYTDAELLELADAIAEDPDAQEA